MDDKTNAPLFSPCDFRSIHDKYRPRVLRYLARMVNKKEAEDLTQDVFVRVERALPDFRGDSSLSTWIYRVATNVARDRLRQPSFKRMVSAEESGDPVSERKPEPEARDIWKDKKPKTAEDQLVQKEMNACIREFIEALPGNYKSVLVLSELEELKNREIAEILGISTDTVKIRLHRARLRLKQKLESGCSFYRNEENELSCDLADEFDSFRKVF